jgi:hypothetical protein
MGSCARSAAKRWPHMLGLGQRQGSHQAAYEPRVYSMVPVPDEADEDARRGVRERSEL